MLSSVCRLQSRCPVLVPLAYSKEFRLIPGPGALMSWKKRTQQHHHMVQLQVWLLPEAFVSCKCPEPPCYLHSPFVSTLYFVLFSFAHVLQAFKFFDDCNWVTCLAISPEIQHTTALYKQDLIKYSFYLANVAFYMLLFSLLPCRSVLMWL